MKAGGRSSSSEFASPVYNVSASITTIDKSAAVSTEDNMSGPAAGNHAEITSRQNENTSMEQFSLASETTLYLLRSSSLTRSSQTRRGSSRRIPSNHESSHIYFTRPKQDC